MKHTRDSKKRQPQTTIGFNLRENYIKYIIYEITIHYNTYVLSCLVLYCVKLVPQHNKGALRRQLQSRVSYIILNHSVI